MVLRCKELTEAVTATVVVARGSAEPTHASAWEIVTWVASAEAGFTDERVQSINDWQRQTTDLDTCPHTRALLVEAGRDRAYRRGDLIDDATWHASSSYRLMYEPFGLADMLTAVVSWDRNHELYVVLSTQRPEGFSTDDRELLAFVVQGARRLWLDWLRLRGLTGCSKPLTPREVTVLRCLLRGVSEKEAAAELGITRRSVHQVVVAIYRKFGVHSRADLMATWLDSPGRPPLSTSPPDD